MDYSELVYTASNLPDKGCFLGNGKLGIFTSTEQDELTIERVVLSKSIEFKNGQYQPNVIDMFCPFGVEMFSTDDMCPTTLTNTSQALHMDTGTLTSSFTLTRSASTQEEQTMLFNGLGSYAVGAGTNVVENLEPLSMNINVSTYCIRHLPYSSMQVIECTNVNKHDLRFLHECWTPDNILDVVYENNVQYVGNDFPLFLFIGHGRTVDNVKVAFTSSYLFDNSNIVTKPMGMGTNISSFKKNFQFNCFDLAIPQNTSTFKIYIVTTFTSQVDFDEPRNEAIRISTYACSPNPVAASHGAVATYIRGRHVDAWQKLWATRVLISAKNDASPQQVAEVTEINKCLYSALYHIYSCVRESFVSESNPQNIPMLDVDGSLIYEADLWLIPLLILLKPDIAKGMIEFRQGSLQLTKQLAASYGYSGGKIPYVDDIIGNRNNLYFNTNAYVHIFNSCMVSINAWNYYRATKDKKWLQDKGYSIIKTIAEYLADIVGIDPDTGDVNLQGIVGLNARISSSNNTYTNNLVRLSLKYGIEASWELQYEVPESWQEIYALLPLPTFQNSKIYKVDDTSFDNDLYNVLEVLHIFTPGFWESFDRSNSLIFTGILKDNFNYYTESKLLDGEGARPINQSLIGTTAGLIMSKDPSYLATYMNTLGNFISSNISTWKQMKKDVKILNKRTDPSLIVGGNSLTTNSMFINMILQGILQMRVVGGVSSTRFYYEEMKVSSVAYATMPSYWNSISVTNFGSPTNPTTIDVRQNAYDMQYNPPNIGGAYIMNGDFGIFTP